jgi:hypothetical protein
MRSRASQKLGSDAPARDARRMAWSGSRFRYSADMTPAGMAIKSDRRAAGMASCSVKGMRWRISVVTDRRVLYEVPRSPCTALPSQSKYWVINGRSRPSSTRTRSMAA